MVDLKRDLDGRSLGPIRRLILQATSFCNIDCSYCYLPGRDRRRQMTVEVVQASAQLVHDSGLAASHIEVRWHCGEPLAAPIDFYDDACPILVRTLAPSRVAFSLQTNGTLIDDAWCDLFERQDIAVGVSIDGPKSLHDQHRSTRRGQGTYDRTVRGVNHLRRRGIPFSVISVVTEATLNKADAYVDFIGELNPTYVGLQPEETEGDHTSGLFALHDFGVRYREFLGRMARFENESGIPVRRLAAMRDRIIRETWPMRNDQVEPLVMIVVDADGRIGSFSPELLGCKSVEYNDFILGNVLDPGCSLVDWPPGFQRLAMRIAEGRELCRRSCDYFSLCGGGAAVNKWTENGTFASSWTKACECNIIAVTDVVLHSLERELGLQER